MFHQSLLLSIFLYTLTYFVYSVEMIQLSFTYIKTLLLQRELKAIKCNNKMWWEKEMEEATEFDFKEIHPLTDKVFWVGKSAYIPSEDDEDIQKCIVHVKTNLLIDYEGNLLGRYVGDDVIPVESLSPEILKWYKNCLNA